MYSVSYLYKQPADLCYGYGIGRFVSDWMWRCILGLGIRDVSKKPNAFLFAG